MSDAAHADVLATTLLLGLAVAIAGAFGAVVRERLVPEPRYVAHVDLTLGPGRDRAWGTGDEVLTLVHAGGEPIPRHDLKLVTAVNGTGTVRPLAAGSTSDGTLSFGDRWSFTLTAPPGASFEAHLVAGSALLARLDTGVVA